MVTFANGVSNRFSVADSDDILLDLASSKCGMKFIRVGTKTLTLYLFQHELNSWTKVGSINVEFNKKDVIGYVQRKGVKETIQEKNLQLEVRTYWKSDSSVCAVASFWYLQRDATKKQFIFSEINFYRILPSSSSSVNSTQMLNETAAREAEMNVYKPQWLPTDIEVPPLVCPSVKVGVLILFVVLN